MDRLRNFVFTLNNYKDIDVENLLSYDCKYLVFAKEVAPKTGTPHLQGYCELNRQTSFAVVKESLPKGTHIEPRYGTQQQAIDYIKQPIAKPVPKPEDLYEKGEARFQGSDVGPSAVETARDLLENNIPINPREHNIGVIKAYERLSKYWPIGRRYSDGDISRIWIYGPGRSGKTARAYEICSGYSTYKCDTAHKGWFDGYDNHEAVILDDYEPDGEDAVQFKLLLSLLDKYSLRVEVKGSTVKWDPKIIVITSQFPPWEYYGSPYEAGQHLNVDLGTPEYWNRNVKLRQLMGRIDRLISYDGASVDVNYPAIEAAR